MSRLQNRHFERRAESPADLMLARSERNAQRFYCMAAQTSQELNDDYNILGAPRKQATSISRVG